MLPFEDLASEVASGRAIAIVGAGVSILATGNAPCASWKGLLHDGARLLPAGIHLL